MKSAILVNFGGPRSKDEIYPFLVSIFQKELPFLLKPFAKILARTRLKKSKEIYEKIGGTSPVVPHMRFLAQEVKNKIANHNIEILIGMEHSSPSIEEAILDGLENGAEIIEKVFLYPFHSKKDEKSWHNDPLHISAIKSMISENYAPNIIFSSHAIPLSRAKKDDTYLKQVEETASLVMQDFPNAKSFISFQSAYGPIKWTSPSTEETLRLLAQNCPGAEVVIVPFGFVCENLETLYEIDQLYLPLAKKLGLRAKRARTVDHSPQFIDLVVKLVLDSFRG